MNPTQLHYALALQAVPNIGDITAKKLIQHCGSPEAVFKTSKQALQSIDGIGTVIIKALQHSNTLKNCRKRT
jgi:DNA processing protein